MKRKHIPQQKWTPEERQSFSDGVGRPRAQTIPCRKRKESKESCRKNWDF